MTRDIKIKSFFVSAFAAALGLFLCGSAHALSFLSPMPYDVGTSPICVATGNFNSGSNLDLAVANADDGTVSILLGIGDGTFPLTVPPAYPPTYAVGTSPKSVAVGDFNGGAYLDLAVANYDSDNVSILIGNGDGTFDPAVNYPAGTSPVSVAVGKFINDTIFDIAVANEGSDNISILIGNGDGTFDPAVNYPAGTSPMSVAVGDFNEDGHPDLAVANWGSDDVSILLGDGAGAFADAVNYPVGTSLIDASPTSVTVGDFNDDTHLDLAVANSDSNDVSILLGNGDGTFQPAANYPAGTSPQSIAAGDFYGVGKLIDLVVANPGSDDVSVLLGKGDGTFAPTVNFPVGTIPMSVAIGNFTGDGNHDIAAANWGDENVSILLKSPVDLSVTVTSSPDPVLWGHDVTYTLTIINSGDPATGVEATDTLPAGTTCVPPGTTQCPCDVAVGTVTCDIGAMANGATVIVDIVAKAPDAPGPLTNGVMLVGFTLANSTTSQETTGEYPVQRFLIAPGYYTTISDSFSLVQNGEEIQAQTATYTETPTLDSEGASVTLKGGYGSGFSGPSGYSTISGSLTISKGTLTVKGIIIR